MSTFDLYIHGTPNGHQIWGSAKNPDYISTFYNHDLDRADKYAMQIDVCMGDSYYTYIRQQNVYDSNGRPGAFFAITVCFTKAYCTNVYKLNQIFEAVYNQVCIGSLISPKHGKEIYLVSDFESSRSGNSTTVDVIRAIFVKKIGELIEPYLLPLGGVVDTFNKAKMQFSLLEVDSPLFVDSFKKQSIIVLPNLEPTSIVNQMITRQLNAIKAQKNALETDNANLRSDIVALTNKNESLSNQLHTSASLLEKKYSSEVNQLKADLKATAQDRDEFKAKLEGFKFDVDKLEGFKSVLDDLQQRVKGDYEISPNSQDISPKKSNKVRLSRLNRKYLVILAIAAICYCIYCIFSAKDDTSNVDSDKQVDNRISSESSEDLGGSEFESADYSEISDKSEVENEEPVTEPQYDEWDECMINIKGGGEELKAGKTYTLFITKGGKKANVPDGEWVVEINHGHPINRGNEFAIDANVETGTNVQIKYIVNGEQVKTRTPKVK